MNTNDKNKNIIVAIGLIVITLLALVCGMPQAQAAYADMGPKPSVTVTVENIGGKICYGTLLSYYESLGPTSAYSPDDPYVPRECDPESEFFNAEEYAVWKAFVDYADPDGYYYQQVH